MQLNLCIPGTQTNIFIITIFNFLFILSIQQSISLDLESNNQYQKYYRQLVKIQNARKISLFNQNKSNSFLLKPNQFIQLSNEQFHGLYTTSVKINDSQTQVNSIFPSSSMESTSPKGASLEQKMIFQSSKCDSFNIDWTVHASPVKQQGKCNSCYAHSSIATIESMMHLQYGFRFDLSQQQITECTCKWAPKGFETANNKGCNGGWGWKSLIYIQYYGVALEENYPYKAGNDQTLKQCNETAIKGDRFSISGYQKYYNNIWPESQCNILNERLQEGKTIAVSIWVPTGIQFQFYGSETKDIDIWNICGNYKNVNHEVQLVGSTDRYWKLKNSYGVQWGQKGYLYLDKSKGLNCLNICMDFAFPTGLPAIEQLNT